MPFSEEIRQLLEDRESGSIALLNQLLHVLEKELTFGVFSKAPSSLSPLAFQLEEIRSKLSHFAAIENFLSELLEQFRPVEKDHEIALEFIAQYREYWKKSSTRLTRNFIEAFALEGKTILTHSQSQTIYSLFEQLYARGISFRVIQTLSSPGNEGRIAYEKIIKLGLQAKLINDERIEEALGLTDLVIVGCDALLQTEFLNKAGTLSILESARDQAIPSALLCESRKIINRKDWKEYLPPQELFEWVPLDLVDRIIRE